MILETHTNRCPQMGKENRDKTSTENCANKATNNQEL